MSLEKLSRIELLKVYCDQKQKTQDQQDGIEELNQQVHYHKREVTRFHHMQDEVNSEIAEFSTVEAVESKQDEKQVLQERIALAQVRHAVRMNDLRDMINQVQSAHSTFEKQLTLAANTTTIETNQFEDENNEMQHNIELLCEEVASKDKIGEEMEKEMATFNEKILESQRELEMCKEKYSLNRAEKESCKEKIETLQVDIAQMKIAIDGLESQPLDEESRGNSMFAEVHDRRVQLEKRAKQFQNSYMNMQLELEKLKMEIKAIDMEKIKYISVQQHAMKSMENCSEKEKHCALEIHAIKQCIEAHMAQISEPFQSEIFDPSVPEDCFIKSLYEDKE